MCVLCHSSLLRFEVLRRHFGHKSTELACVCMCCFSVNTCRLTASAKTSPGHRLRMLLRLLYTIRWLNDMQKMFHFTSKSLGMQLHYKKLWCELLTACFCTASCSPLLWCAQNHTQRKKKTTAWSYRWPAVTESLASKQQHWWAVEGSGDFQGGQKGVQRFCFY